MVGRSAGGGMDSCGWKRRNFGDIQLAGSFGRGRFGLDFCKDDAWLERPSLLMKEWRNIGLQILFGFFLFVGFFAP